MKRTWTLLYTEEPCLYVGVQASLRLWNTNSFKCAGFGRCNSLSGPHRCCRFLCESSCDAADAENPESTRCWGHPSHHWVRDAMDRSTEAVHYHALPDFYFLQTFRWNIQSTRTARTGAFVPLSVNTGFLKHRHQHSSNAFTVMFWLMMPIKPFCLTLCLPVLRSSDGPILGSANIYNRTSARLNGKRKSIVVEQTPIGSTRNMLRVQSASCYHGNNEGFL